ncbi:hypothetical protein GCM10027440_05440 [Nocardiopsis coralliicola]
MGGQVAGRGDELRLQDGAEPGHRLDDPRGLPRGEDLADLGLGARDVLVQLQDLAGEIGDIHFSEEPYLLTRDSVGRTGAAPF